MGLTNHDVARRWVEYNEPKTYKRLSAGSGSLTFVQETLRSYRTPIARYYKDFVLLTSEKWGVTTAHHINIAERFVNFPSFRVPCIEIKDNVDRRVNALHLQDVLTKQIDRAIRYFKARAETEHGMAYYLFNQISTAHGNLWHYARLTGLRIPIDPLPKILDWVKSERERKWVEYNDPKAVKRRERQQARREAKQALGV